ncbi:MAG: damage-inducible protein DinB [Candidatus Cloacimonetes bacterium]|jgi:uncharacterized damage-inducible protein DinB|nr:damage-inducible protein DinB [Candidatus Cloacimonadota bacterium]
MSFLRDLLPEFDEEMRTTRRVLERVPSDRADWKPHPRSFSLAHLAQLVATMPGWLITMLGETELDLSKGSGYSNQSTEELLKSFDEGVKQARTMIQQAKDDEMAVPWSLKMGDNVLFTLPRQVVVRQHINHLVHHRGQLTVYLRLLDVPVPSIYGPTADEPWGAQQSA